MQLYMFVYVEIGFWMSVLMRARVCMSNESQSRERKNATNYPIQCYSLAVALEFLLRYIASARIIVCTWTNIHRTASTLSDDVYRIAMQTKTHTVSPPSLSAISVQSQRKIYNNKVVLFYEHSIAWTPFFDPLGASISNCRRLFFCSRSPSSDIVGHGKIRFQFFILGYSLTIVSRRRRQIPFAASKMEWFFTVFGVGI